MGTAAGARRQSSSQASRAGDSSLPVGTVTFLMTDLEGSTRAWDLSPRSARQALERHNEIVIAHITGQSGQVVELGREGDGVLAVFSQATDAILSAFEIQRALQHESWPAGAELQARIAVHTGEAELSSGHYIGVPLYRCGRLLGIAHGGQVLVSTATEEIAGDELAGGLGLRDLGLHRLRDLSRPEHVYQLTHPDLRADFPPLMSVAAPARYLPRFLTTFINREAELRSLKPLLVSSRMVTLIGTGGAGKSRLAAELANATDQAWPDGMWWVDLAAESSVGGAVVTNLELPGRGSPERVVAAWLASRHGLLILDNCVHLVADCARFCQFVLERCPGITILATSREALGVPGEVRWTVGPLESPHALDLFEARARLVLPDFKAVPGNRDRVVAICNRLDRLPLAIEMAAARLDLMSERELLANLTDRFQVLVSGTRTVHPRQQTMAATIDWSYRLLTAEESRLFRRLAVFQGGFSLEAARAVCADGDGADVMQILRGLVQKSMAVADRLDDSTRYRLLESHHDFAQAKLAESGEIDQVERRHHAYFSARKWEPADSSNFWHAATWARSHAADGGLELVMEIGDANFSDQARAKNLILELLDRAEISDAMRAKALTMAARLTWRQADHAGARRLAESAVAQSRKFGDREVLARALSGAGLIYETSGELGLAGKAYDEALTLLEHSDDRVLVADLRNLRGLLAIAVRDPKNGLALLTECVATARSLGDPPRLARYLESLANAQLDVNDIEGAASSWMEALSLFRAVDDWFGIIWSLVGLSLAAASRREDEHALRLAAAADRLRREYSLSLWPFRAGQLDAACQQARQRLGKSRGDAAWSEGATLGTEEAIDYALGAQTAAAQPTVGAGPLSAREAEVAAMVALGMTNKEIAQRLFIAERTAEGHVERIRNKLGVRSRTEVATWAVAHGLRALDKRPPTSKV
jgi:predicted ATPase/class 3 adenylate cyclase/DNA-binding CsgD family transcriptional regulator